MAEPRRPRSAPSAETEAGGPYAALRSIVGLPAADRRVEEFLRSHRARRPDLEPGAGYASVDLRRLGVRLLFWVGWESERFPKTYAVEPGTLVEAQFFQEGIERHQRFAGRLPRGLDVDMTRDALCRALGPPTEACDCGQEPACFYQWHVRDFDEGLEAHVTHHAKHVGRTRPRPGRVDISAHIPRAG